MLALLVACETMYGPVQTPIAADKAGEITITIDEVKDSSVTFTVAPQSNSGYYSYLVQLGDKPATIDVNTLYSNGYKESDGTVSSGSIKWTEEKKASTITLKKLSPNTTYQIYAVASSPMGIVGKHVNANFKTSDKVNPTFTNIAIEGEVITFAFSENVTYNKQSTPIKITYYAPYSPAFATDASSAGTVDVPADSVAVSGASAVVNIPKVPTGCYYTIEVPEGVFQDAVGLATPAYASTIVMVETENGPKPSPEGVYGSLEYVELPMLGKLEQDTFKEGEFMFDVPLVSKYPFAGYSTKKFITITYVTESDNKVERTTYVLTPKKEYVVTGTKLMFAIPEEPSIGSNVEINIPAGCFYDIYGNDCEEWEHTMMYSYGYTLNDIVGTYDLIQQSALTLQASPSKLVIEESNNKEKGNVMFTSYFGIDCSKNPIYATFNMDEGFLTIPSPQIFYFHNIEGVEYPYVICSAVVIDGYIQMQLGKDPINISVPSPNKLSGPDWFYGVFILSPDGKQIIDVYDIYSLFEGDLASSEPAPQATSLTSRLGPITIKR